MSARQMFPGIDREAARLVKHNGNITQVVWNANGKDIIALPTKYHYRDPSPLSLILSSVEQLVALANKKEYSHVLLTRPGCGYGGHSWPAIEELLREDLDDRFIVCYK